MNDRGPFYSGSYPVNGVDIKRVGWGGREVQEEVYIHTYGWLMLIYGRKQHIIVKQVFFN